MPWDVANQPQRSWGSRPAGEIPLPPGLEHHHGDGIGKVEAALAGQHRQAQAALGREFGHHFGGQAARFTAKDEGVARIEGHVTASIKQ